MRYLDSGRREPAHALGTWLQAVMSPDVAEVRWQTGFFASDALGIIQPALAGLARNDQTVRALIGSNDQGTIRRDVERLVAMLGMPRHRARLGVISYRDGFFHPKTFHVRRADGSQAAYVGSANLTGSGVASLHVEAGVTVDSRDGDSVQILNEVAGAVDFWFDASPAGLYAVETADDIERLVLEGVISEAPPLRATVVRPAAEGGAGRPMPANRLRPLLVIPRVRELVAEEAAEEGEVGRLREIVLPVAPREGFPQYLLFAPALVTPTTGVTALSGASLPMGAAGLIIRLNRDSARHFDGRLGTANISVPVATLSTLRFGLFPGAYKRPRAEFHLRIRYIDCDAVVPADPLETNIMAYGFIRGEAGHGDVRMLVPAGIRALAEHLNGAHREVPREGDVALLEWPTTNAACEFRLSFLSRSCELFRQADALFRRAQEQNETVGAGACWMPLGFSQPW